MSTSSHPVWLWPVGSLIRRSVRSKAASEQKRAHSCEQSVLERKRGPSSQNITIIFATTYPIGTVVRSLSSHLGLALKCQLGPPSGPLLEEENSLSVLHFLCVHSHSEYS